MFTLQEAETVCECLRNDLAESTETVRRHFKTEAGTAWLVAHTEYVEGLIGKVVGLTEKEVND